MKMRSTFAIGLALAAVPAAVVAQTVATRAPCMTEDEVAALVVYAMPSLINSARTSCSSQLSPNGFIATGGTALAQRYAAKGNAAWPKARSGLVKIVGAEDENMAMIANLPDNAIRPLVDALIEQKVAEEIKPDSCRDIERFAKVLNFLEPEETGALSGVIASLALGKDDEVQICRALN